jgi:signal transduction histidine kinase
MTALSQRLLRLQPAAMDGLLAAVVLVGTELALVLDEKARTPHPVLAFLVCAVIGGALLIRRTHPVIAVAIAMLAQLADDLAGGNLASGSAALLAAMLLAYSLGRYAQGRQLAVGVLLMVTGYALNAGYADDGYLNELAFGVLVATLLPVAGGALLRRRALLIGELARQRAELERERDARVAEAAAAERVRIAHELNDVVVQDVSAMVVQATAAREIVRSRPGEAVDAIVKVESAGRQALQELRRALGVLRASDRSITLEPQPTLARLPALVESLCSHGAKLDLEVAGSAADLPADFQLAAYRVVQEVLAAADGSIGHGSVRIARDGPDVQVDVRHDGTAPADLGLAAARERVAIFDGRLDVNVSGQGESWVCVRLPFPA